MPVQIQQKVNRGSVHVLFSGNLLDLNRFYQTKEEMSSLKCSLVSIDSFKQVQHIQISHFF